MTDRAAGKSSAGAVAAHIKTAAQALRPAARYLWHALPLAEDVKLRIKIDFVRRFGPLLGIDTAWYRTVRLAPAGTLLAPGVAGKCLSLAGIACGLAQDRPRPSVSIVIPVFNQLDYTLRCLASVIQSTQDDEHEIIVVDDASSDGTRAALQGRSDIVYIRNETNLGFIGACNAGARAARNNYVCFLNNDTEVGRGWMTALLGTFDLFENVGLVGAKLVFADGRLQEAGCIVWEDFTAANWGRLADSDNPSFNYARQVDYCSGAAIVLPRALFDALGGFDPMLAPAYGEDSDIAFKVRALGLKTVYQPLARVVHHEGITSGRDLMQGVKAYQSLNAVKLRERWRYLLPHQGSAGEHRLRAADRGTVGRILIVDQMTPEPDKDAGSITALEIMRALRDLGLKVDFAPSSVKVAVSPYTETLSALGIQSVLAPWDGSLRAHLKEFGSAYDAVMLFRLPTAMAHLKTVRELAPDARIIFHPSDLHFVRETRQSHIEDAAGPAGDGVSDATREAECEAIRAATVTVVHSSYEKALIADLVPDARVETFPWIFEPRGRGLPFAERAGIGFLGGYRHAPNADAVRYFLADILPLIRREIPDVHFYAIGSDPPDWLEARRGDDVSVTGLVDDLAPLLHSLRVAVAPLRFGAGLKGKIVTTMAHGLPTVATSIGAEGMQLTAGREIIVSDDPGDFAARVVELYRHEAQWAPLARASYDWVGRACGREKGMRTMARILDMAGVPFVRSRVAGDEEQPFMRYGTPPAVRSVATMADTLRRALSRRLGGDCTPALWLGATGAFAQQAGFRTVQSPTEPIEHLVAVFPFSSVALLVDAITAAEDVLAPQGLMCFAILAPTLDVDGADYKMAGGNDDSRVGPSIGLPLSERLVPALAASGISVEVDGSLLGFPSSEIFFLPARRGAK